MFDVNFGVLESNRKISTFAHELGHVYGMTHVTGYSGNTIMNGSLFVADTDRAGMQVFTHEHVHSTTNMGTYTITQYSTSAHKCTCNQCKAYLLLAHSYITAGNNTYCQYCGASY